MTVFIADEIRSTEMWPDAENEMRSAPDSLTFEGYAAVFNMPSLPMAFPDVAGGKKFRETVQPGAFSKTLANNPDVSLLFQHNMSMIPLARTKAGTMSLTQDDRGLLVRATLPDNEYGRTARDAIARRDISGMSFRFSTVVDKVHQTELGLQRDLHEIRLGPEVSLTTIPAYPDTTAMIRSLADTSLDELLAILDELPQEQRDLVYAHCHSQVSVPHIHPSLAEARERFAKAFAN